MVMESPEGYSYPQRLPLRITLMSLRNERDPAPLPYTIPFFLKIQTKFKGLKLTFKFDKERNGIIREQCDVVSEWYIFILISVWQDGGLTSGSYHYQNIIIYIHYYSLLVDPR